MQPTPRELYVDLLLKSVSNLIYGPAPTDPWNDGLFRRDSVPGRDMLSPAHTMVGLLRLQNLADLVQRVLDAKVPGHFIETGVWRGGCCILMRGILAANGISDRNVYVADSFEGLPPPDAAAFPDDAGDRHHTYKELAVPIDAVKANFQCYGLLDEQVKFVKGFFRDTLPTLDGSPFALLRLDGDMYESTIQALEALYSKLSIGGYVIIDDYGAVPQCAKAVEDFRTSRGIDEGMIRADWTALYWQKLHDR